MGPLRSFDGDGFYMGSSTPATDGLRGTTATAVWPELTSTTAHFITITFQINPTPTLGHPPRLFALLNLTGAIRVGTIVELVGGTNNNPTNVIATTTVRALPDGQLGIWLYVQSQTQVWDWWGWKIYNNDGEGAYIFGPEATTFGEVFGDTVDTYCVTTISSQLVDPTRINRSSYNLARRLMRKPFRQLTVSVQPVGYDEAFIDPTGNLQELSYRMAQADYVAMVQREFPEATGIANADYVQSTAMLARVTNIGAIASEARNDRWPLSLSFEELL